MRWLKELLAEYLAALYLVLTGKDTIGEDWRGL